MFLLQEIMRSMRNFKPIPGARFITLTPVLGHPELEEIFNNQQAHPTFKFYTYNTKKNTAIKNLEWINSIPFYCRASNYMYFFLTQKKNI